MSQLDDVIGILRDGYIERGNSPKTVNSLMDSLRGLIEQYMEEGMSEEAATTKGLDFFSKQLRQMQLRRMGIVDGRHR